ncbi:NAD(P)H-dependent oxidoreductase subunit E [Thermodesulfobacteriota bacterium]
MISLCTGSGCGAYGTAKVYEALTEEVARQNMQDDVEIKRTGCHGFCEKGPILVIHPEGVFYPQVKEKHIPKIVEETIKNGNLIKSLCFKDPSTKKRITHEQDIPFYKLQQRIIFGNNSLIESTKIEDYISVGGYEAFEKALFDMTPEEIIDQVEKSGLRGRGGAGFPTGTKWKFCSKYEGDRYVICNADEGDPGAYMDRSLLEGNPHSVIEGMLIGALGIGSHAGYVYVRHEYPLAVQNLSVALKAAKEAGLLGENILGSGFDFDIRISRGGGAFVCGEETALMKSIEGKRGTPRSRPPFPAEKGVWEQPTILNNVETWANIPLIVGNGAEWYSSIGTESSKGTKIFSLVGKVTNTGLVEVPMGTSLRTIIFDIGGGVPRKKVPQER